MILKSRPRLVISSWLLAVSLFVFTSEAKAAEKLNFIHQDHLGSTALVTDSTGKVVSKQSYYPYGTTRSQTSDVGSKKLERQYTGQISDEDETGLYYYNARYYDPTLAKFTQADSLNDGLNKYTYVANNPIVFSDPTGNQCEPWTYPCDYDDNEIDTVWEAIDDIKSSVYKGRDEITAYYPDLGEHLSYLDKNLQSEIELYVPHSNNPLLFAVYIKLNMSKGGIVSEGSFILSKQPQIASVELEELNEDFKRYTPDADFSYGNSFLHEARHYWQFTHDPGGQFINQITSYAGNAGIIRGSKSNDFSYYVKPDEILPIHPHGFNNDFTKVSWSNQREVDAIIAETMTSELSRNRFRNDYPYLWNLMLSKPGYFNPEVFHPVRSRNWIENRH